MNVKKLINGKKKTKKKKQQNQQTFQFSLGYL